MPKNSKGIDTAHVTSNCSGCQICLAKCDVDAISFEDGIAVIDSEKCTGCAECVSVCPSDAIIFDASKHPTIKEQKKQIAETEDYTGIAVLLEIHNETIEQVSLELIGKARELADKVNTHISAFILGNYTLPIQDLFHYGCDKVFIVNDKVLDTYSPSVYGKTLAKICETVKPEILLTGSTFRGCEISAIAATILKTGLTADCTALDITEDRLLVMTRPTFGGNIMATIFCKDQRPQMSTVRPGVMKMSQKDNSRTGTHEYLKVDIEPDNRIEVLEKIILSSNADKDISNYDVLIVIGKGISNSQNLPLIEELASLLNAGIACSRPLIECGMFPYEKQVGQTGKTVTPKLYIGIGVSGSIQHMAGMINSEKIIAINTDPNAPIVKSADYSIIGDYAKIVPELIHKIKFMKEGTL